VDTSVMHKYDKNKMSIDFSQKYPNNRTINIVCHGHSVPAGYFKTPLVNTFDSYPHMLHRLLKKRYPYAVFNVIVTAIGGENSEQGSYRFEKDVLTHKPDIILIDYALNDRRIGLQRAKTAWVSMIEKSIKNNIVTILLTSSADSTSNIDNDKDPLNELAEMIRQLSTEYGVFLADSFYEFFKYYEKYGSIDLFMSQHNHPNKNGHRLIIKALTKCLKKQLGVL